MPTHRDLPDSYYDGTKRGRRPRALGVQPQMRGGFVIALIAAVWALQSTAAGQQLLARWGVQGHRTTMPVLMPEDHSSTKPVLPYIPELGAPIVEAYRVADAHWPHSRCAGRQQVDLADDLGGAAGKA